MAETGEGRRRIVVVEVARPERVEAAVKTVAKIKTRGLEDRNTAQSLTVKPIKCVIAITFMETRLGTAWLQPLVHGSTK